MSFPCIACRTPNAEVMDSRPTHVNDLPAVRRRRRCKTCGHRFTTFEVSEVDTSQEKVDAARVALRTMILMSNRLLAQLNGDDLKQKAKIDWSTEPKFDSNM